MEWNDSDIETDSLSGTPDLSAAEIESDIADDGFAQWSDTMTQLNPDMDEASLQALWEDPCSRTPHQVELADAVLHPEYETQLSFAIDETGSALRDENGDWVEMPYGAKGSQRPDGFLEDTEGIHLREQKCYHDLGNLMHNIEAQTDDRREAFGEDVDLTYVVAPNFTVEEAERLQRYCEEDLGVSLEWQLK